MANEAVGHVAIIMDGNGRWARLRGKPRAFGHRAGAEAVRRTVEAAAGEGISALTLYAFSSDNWGRPPEEVNALFALFGEYLRKETEGCLANGIRLRVIGRRERLPAPLQEVVENAEARTAAGSRMLLRLAVDYSARDAIVAACGQRPMAFTGRHEFALSLIHI